jgi:hypothetical protein
MTAEHDLRQLAVTGMAAPHLTRSELAADKEIRPWRPAQGAERSGHLRRTIGVPGRLKVIGTNVKRSVAQAILKNCRRSPTIRASRGKM